MFYSGGHTFGEHQPGTGPSSTTGAGRDRRHPRPARVGLRDQSGSVLLPPAQDQGVMIAGGGNIDTNTAGNGLDRPDRHEGRRAVVAGPGPACAGRTGPDVPEPDHPLPDRTVLASNGATHTGNRHGPTWAGCGVSTTRSTNTWTTAAADPIGRNYHSAAVLLQDGRVAVFGSNPADGSYEMRISLYEPPYLFKRHPPDQASDELRPQRHLRPADQPRSVPAPWSVPPLTPLRAARRAGAPDRHQRAPGRPADRRRRTAWPR